MDPPQYDVTARKKRYQGRGVFKIVYQDGRIVSVTATQSTGVRYLDDLTISHIQRNFTLKPGVSGAVLQPVKFQLVAPAAQFVSTPAPHYDNVAKRRGYQGRGIFQIEYKDGQIVNVAVVQSTGVAELDARTIAHIKTRYRVKPGATGIVRAPISYRLVRMYRGM